MTRRVLLAGAVGAVAAGTAGALLWRTRQGAEPQIGPLPELLTTPEWRVPTVHDGYGPDGCSNEGRYLSNQEWLDRGRLPGAASRWQSMASWGLIDLKNLMSSGNGAVAAGAATRWGYSWSRDNAFVVAAMVRSGHRSEALQVLDFMRFVQLPDGGFLPRDLLSGGAPDDRHAQSDGAGWALWAVSQLLAVAPNPARDQLETRGAPVIASTAAAELTQWRPMVDSAVAFIEGDLVRGRGLPTPSSDYWERRETKLTLATTAVLLLGLRSATAVYTVVGDDGRAEQVRSRADDLEDRLHRRFAPAGYQRYATSGGQDAAVCWLLPPFTDEVRTPVLDAWNAYQRDAARPGGGLAPGVGWKRDGISWTPEVAQVALTAAATGHSQVAEKWLDWLDAHRVSWGSLPEKVLPDGAPAGPAPLGWTASTTLLTLDQLS